MSTTIDDDTNDKNELTELIAHRDAILSVLRAANIDTNEYERSTNSVINKFAANCVEAKADSFDA